jgi:hypothetical protein
MEVLASMFVICIGLLGVLAVIPYGAYQTAKAKNAENTSWVLANAEKDLQTMGLAQMHTWKIPSTIDLITTHSYQLDGTSISGQRYFLNHPTQADKRYDCQTYLLVDPFNTGVTTMDLVGYLIPHVRVVGAGNNGSGGFDNLPLWLERLSGQDDLVYTTHSDKRTDFSGQNNKILSSGQYTWFFMFRPQFDDIPVSPDPAGGASQVGRAIDADVLTTADVDILGCYNRIPGEAKTVYAHYVAYNDLADDYDPLFNGAAITFRSNSAEALDVSKTKYIFISWPRFRGTSTLHHVEGCWCKIINATQIEQNNRNIFIPEITTTWFPQSYKRTIYVTGTPSFVSQYGGAGGLTTPPYPEGIPNFNEGGGNAISIRGLIIPGVMYHKRIPNVTVK